MSGVYIGMEMPKSCRKCKLKMNCDNCEGWECYCLPLGENIGYMDDEPGIPSEKRRDDCPLIPVPDHGRLIDADKLRENEFIQDGDAYAVVMSRHIRNAPTILPADLEEKEDKNDG